MKLRFREVKSLAQSYNASQSQDLNAYTLDLSPNHSDDKTSVLSVTECHLHPQILHKRGGQITEPT